VTARSRGSTFIVSDEPHKHTDPVISRQAYDELAAAQDAYIATRDVIVIDGYIGDHPIARMRTRLVVERANANLAAMQRLLYFGRRLPSRTDGDLHAESHRRLPTTAASWSISKGVTASSTPTTSASRRWAACGCGTPRCTGAAGWPCTAASS
jgi:hypothetical protein